MTRPGYSGSRRTGVFALTGTTGVAIVATLVLGSGGSFADDGGTISAERPGFSSSPISLAPGLLQIEAGYQYSRDDAGPGTDAHSIPLSLFRIGLADDIELQLSWGGATWADSAGRSANGITDAGIGVKWRLNGATAAVPVGLFAGVSLPVGADEFTSDSIDPSLGAFWTHSAGLDWFGTVILSHADDDTVLSNAVGISLPVSAGIGGYVEYFGHYAGDGGPEHFLNGGLTYLPRNDMQFDLHLGAGLNDRAADFFLGLGVAYRF